MLSHCSWFDYSIKKIARFFTCWIKNTMPGPASSIGRASAYNSSHQSSIQQISDLLWSWQFKMPNLDFSKNLSDQRGKLDKKADLILYSVKQKWHVARTGRPSDDADDIRQIYYAILQISILATWWSHSGTDPPPTVDYFGKFCATSKVPIDLIEGDNILINIICFV